MTESRKIRLTNYASCAGWAGKLPVELTAQVVCNLPTVSHPDLLAGAEHFEDAGIMRLRADLAIVQTVDFFPPLVDDPYTFGRIAAANSLSDLYAMGATPLTALNIVGFPDKELPAEVLHEILRGGAERVTAAGAITLGGHSVRDAEVKYGLAATGTIHPDKIIRNHGAKGGDVLALTKPIGSGVLTSAAKKNLITEDDLAEAIDTMVALNDRAAAAMQKAGVSAATDITGFGLLGHAFEMADASQVTLVIEAANVPLLEHTERLAAEGTLTRAHRATLDHLGNRLSVESTCENLVNILADAQTSGGLLIAGTPREIESITNELAASGQTCVIIGYVKPGAGKVELL